MKRSNHGKFKFVEAALVSKIIMDGKTAGSGVHADRQAEPAGLFIQREKIGVAQPPLALEPSNKNAAGAVFLGEARFFEPATNSVWLERLRWVMPVPARPSILQRNAFREWRARDPHPERDNSSAHFREVASRFFSVVEIVPVGSIERLHRLLPPGERNRAFRRWALRAEQSLPRSVQLWAARSQTLVMREPRIEAFRP